MSPLGSAVVSRSVVCLYPCELWAHHQKDDTMSNIIPLHYEGHAIRFDLDVWLNATDIAKRFGKDARDWVRQFDTLEYMAELSHHLGVNSGTVPQLNKISELGNSKGVSRSKILRLAKETGLVRIRAGAAGGTWLHPKLAVFFARWLNAKFAVWCDMQIESLLSSGVGLREKLDAAIEAVERQRERGRTAGRELARHRYKMPPLENQRDGLLEQIQLSLEIAE